MLDFFNWRYVYFVWPLKYLIKKLIVRSKRGTVILTKVKSCYALLLALVVCISICLKSALRYKYLILDICIPDTLCTRDQGCEDPWLFFETKRGPRAKTFCETLYLLWMAFILCSFQYGACLSNTVKLLVILCTESLFLLPEI